MLEVNKKFDEKFGNEDKIKEWEKLHNKIKNKIKKGKLIDNRWNDNNKLSSIIYSCINVEDNIKNLNLINPFSSSDRAYTPTYVTSLSWGMDYVRRAQMVNDNIKKRKINND